MSRFLLDLFALRQNLHPRSRLQASGLYVVSAVSDLQISVQVRSPFVPQSDADNK